MEKNSISYRNWFHPGIFPTKATVTMEESSLSNPGRHLPKYLLLSEMVEKTSCVSQEDCQPGTSI